MSKRNKFRWLQAAGMIFMDQPADPANTGTGTDPVAPPKPTRTFTQQEVSALATREADQAARKARADMAEQLGVTLEEAAEIIKATRAAEDKDKTEAQRAREAADAEKAEAAKERAAARAEVFATRVERALTRAGMPEKAQAHVSVSGVDHDSSFEDIEAAVAKLKEDVPTLFGTADPVPTPPNADPSNDRKAKRTPKATFGAEGVDRFKREQERAAARRGVDAIT